MKTSITPDLVNSLGSDEVVELYRSRTADVYDSAMQHLAEPETGAKRFGLALVGESLLAEDRGQGLTQPPLVTRTGKWKVQSFIPLIAPMVSDPDLAPEAVHALFACAREGAKLPDLEKELQPLLAGNFNDIDFHYQPADYYARQVFFHSKVHAGNAKDAVKHYELSVERLHEMVVELVSDAAKKYDRVIHIPFLREAFSRLGNGAGSVIMMIELLEKMPDRPAAFDKLCGEISGSLDKLREKENEARQRKISPTVGAPSSLALPKKLAKATQQALNALLEKAQPILKKAEGPIEKELKKVIGKKYSKEVVFLDFELFNAGDYSFNCNQFLVGKGEDERFFEDLKDGTFLTGKNNPLRELPAIVEGAVGGDEDVGQIVDLFAIHILDWLSDRWKAADATKGSVPGYARLEGGNDYIELDSGARMNITEILKFKGIDKYKLYSGGF